VLGRPSPSWARQAGRPQAAAASALRCAALDLAGLDWTGLLYCVCFCTRRGSAAQVPTRPAHVPSAEHPTRVGVIGRRADLLRPCLRPHARVVAPAAPSPSIVLAAIAGSHPRRALPALWFEFSQRQPRAGPSFSKMHAAAPLNPETRPSSEASATPCRRRPLEAIAVPISFLALLCKRAATGEQLPQAQASPDRATQGKTRLDSTRRDWTGQDRTASTRQPRRGPAHTSSSSPLPAADTSRRALAAARTIHGTLNAPGPVL
jgi:hypothetical protein